MTVLYLGGLFYIGYYWLLLFSNTFAVDSSTYYDQSCACTATSSNGYYCEKWSCRIDQKQTCFSGRSTVLTKDGRRKHLSDVNIGDEVLVLDGNDRLVFEPIFDFIHMEKMGIYAFRRLTVVNTHENTTSAIEISPEHLIFVFGKAYAAVQAARIQVGDLVKVVRSNYLVPGLVINAEETIAQGFLAPLTRSGTIVIDGILASNYAVVRSHRMAHFFMQPYRWWRMIVGPPQRSQSQINPYAAVLYEFVKSTGLLTVF